MAKRSPKKHPVVPRYYETEPYVPNKVIANKPLVQNASLGNDAPKMVPHKPGRSSGLQPSAPGHRLPSPGRVTAPQPNLKLKLSGHSSAHQLGKK